ncbi:MAG: EpsG family protein [Prevotella sp.]|nr:EpsG family protein [Prevotella sp.]
MFLYLAIFFLIVAIYFSTYEKKANDVRILVFCMALLGIFVGISDMLGGYDRYIYAELFDDVANRIVNKENVFQAEIFNLYRTEPGYNIFNVLIGLFTRNRYIFIFITTIIIYALLFASFKRYMENYPYAVLLFMGLWFFFTFTYFRQVMAASIAWLSIQYIVDRKRWRFLSVLLIAMLFHNSAIVFVPLYFVPIKKFDKTRVLIVMVICLLLGLSNITGGLFEAYGSIVGAEDRAEIYTSDESGFRIAYLVEAVFFLGYILYNYHKIPQKPLNLVMLNMGLIFCAILLIFVRSENGGRLGWYYMIGIIATITYLATHTRKITYLGATMLFVSLFLYYRILFAWGVLLSPYKTFFTDGVREGDYIEEKYEYDHNYDIDKFYK